MGKLTAAGAKAASKPGKYHDQFGLMLIVQPSGSKQWVQRLTIQGRRRELGLGGYPLVSLAEAREAAFDNKRIARRGDDPRPAKRHVPTFAEASETVIELHESTWKDRGRSANNWRASMDIYAMPKIGKRRIDQIAVSDILAILKPIWTEKPETAKKVKSRMQRVFEWAVATEQRADNPVRAAGSVLPKGNGRAKHFKALPHAAVAGALATIRDSAAAPVTKLAIEFLALTATRSGEVRLAAWDEIDTDAALWTVPAERTKTGREFRVPLSPAALGVLRAAKAYRDGDMVFPSPRGRALSDATLSKLFRSLGIPAVPHGFRSSFRDWAGEVAKTPREVAEACLAHVVQSKVEAAYARSDLLERRRELMDAWAAYVEGENR